MKPSLAAHHSTAVSVQLCKEVPCVPCDFLCLCSFDVMVISFLRQVLQTRIIPV